MKIVSIDTEFNSTNEKYVNPVCCVLRFPREGNRVEEYWTHNDKNIQNKLKEDIEKLVEQDYYFIGYFISAETRFLLSIGLDNNFILNMNWIDLYPLWREILHTDKNFSYGEMMIQDRSTKQWEKHYTTPPPESLNYYLKDEETTMVVYNDDGTTSIIQNKKHKKRGFGLVDICYRLLNVFIDSNEKDLMRSLIINSKVYDKFQKEKILNYCAEDTKYLFQLLGRLYTIYKENYNIELMKDINIDPILAPNIIQKSSRWVVCCGIMENNGIPINYEKLNNFKNNYLKLKNSIIENCNSVYPFYVDEEVEKRKKKKAKYGTFQNLFSDIPDSVEFSEEGEIKKYVKKEVNFNEFIEKLGIEYPKTEKGKYKTDDDTLKTFSGIKEIRTLRSTRKSLNHIAHFNPNSVMYDHIGSDSCIRLLHSPYSSLTSRNQPSIKRGWIFGMSKWVRPLIEAPKGYCLIGCDYSSEEIFLQAVLSKDKVLLESYLSEDPYIWLAKQSGAIPKDVVRTKGKYYRNNVLVSLEEQTEYNNTRGIYKALTLGIGYGMGVASLANSMTSAMINTLPQEKQSILHDYFITNNLTPEVEDILNYVQFHSITEYKKKGILPEKQNFVYPPERISNTYKNLHIQTFGTYWIWRDVIYNMYLKYGKLELNDGYHLLKGLNVKKEKNTILNFPIQGTGAYILREATYNLISKGYDVRSTLHDAIYVVAKEEDVDRVKIEVAKIMRDTCTECVGVEGIRVDADVYKTDWDNLESTWVKEEGLDEFKMFGKYFNK